jgi:nucleoside-diphosphate-sugar epimerase
MKLFIFGAGFSGRAIAAELKDVVQDIVGTTRSLDKAESLARDGVRPLLFDGGADGKLEAALAGTTHLVQSIAPGEQGDAVLRLFGDDIGRLIPDLCWIGYLSTVGVYGNHDGARVNEDSECRPVSKRSLWRMAAEEGWRNLSRDTGVPVAILRLSGIYGPGRNAFVNLERGTARRLVKPGQVFNRIHVDDIAGAARHLLEKGETGVWNVTDDEPAPPQDVVLHASRVMGVDPPPEIAFEEAELSPMARSFYGENKRVSNAKLKASGYAFRYPNYRVALETMWRNGSWRGEAEESPA